MAQKPKKPPYSWFRWQMRPRIYEEDKFAPKKGVKDSPSFEDESVQNTAENKAEITAEHENLGETEDVDGKEKEEKIELEKGDLFAMILSAMITIFPICVGLLLLIVLLAYFLFFH